MYRKWYIPVRQLQFIYTTAVHLVIFTCTSLTACHDRISFLRFRRRQRKTSAL